MSENESTKTEGSTFDGSLDEELAELGAIEDQIRAHAEYLGNLFQHLEMLEDIRFALTDFRKRLQTIERLLLGVAWDMGSFLYGHIYSAAVGAYECFMHDVIEVLVDSDHFSKLAVMYLAAQEYDALDTVSLRLKKKPVRTREEARDRFRRATLIDAEKIANTVKRLFDLDFPVPADSKKVARLRNLFSHNGGVNADGSIEHISKDGVLDLVHQLDELVADTTTRLNAIIERLSTREESN